MDSSLYIRSMRVHYKIVTLEFLEKVKLLLWKEDECLFMHVSPGGTPFFYFDRDLVSTLGMSFPLTDFQCVLLRSQNLAPSHLHDNSWAMVRIF